MAPHQTSGISSGIGPSGVGFYGNQLYVLPLEHASTSAPFILGAVISFCTSEKSFFPFVFLKDFVRLFLFIQTCLTLLFQQEN